jgi:hypothetical protein
MSTKKSPWDNSPVPARTQETVFGVPQSNASDTTGVNLNDALDSVPTHRTMNQETRLQPHSKTVVVPAGHEVIIFRKDFAPELITELETHVASISALKPVTSQADVEAQNTLLKNASRFMTKFETERKAMGEPLKSVTDELLQIQKNTLAEILQLVSDKNTEIVNFQKAEAKKAAALAAEIQKQKDKEIQDAKNEATRKQNILNLIAQFESNVLNAIATSTIDTIDNLILGFDNFKLKQESYMEFLPQAEAMQKELKIKFTNRKSELQKLADLEKTNKLQADQLRLQQEQQANADKQAALDRNAEQVAAVEEQAQSDIANTTMQAEFKTSVMPVAKNVMKKWGFDTENVDMAALPLEYHTFDKVKIDAAIAQGARNIPGILIEQRISNVKK